VAERLVWVVYAGDFWITSFFMDEFTPTPRKRRPLRPVMNGFYNSYAEKSWPSGKGVGVYRVDY
jgi:hypothetical protein